MTRIGRVLIILRTIRRQQLQTLIDADQLPLLPRVALKLLGVTDNETSVETHSQAAIKTRGERLRCALEELGPVFIKFGQMISTRRDLLPDDIADELAHLQDDVPPFPQEQSIEIIEAALGQPLAELFSSFETTPMASASVAQVHKATLPNGEDVVVKVLRPDIESVIRKDLELMFTLARLAVTFLPQAHRLRPVEVVADYQNTILDELDLGREAANTSQLRRNFADSNLVYVPEVYWDYSRRNVLTMERINGIPVTDLDALRAKGTDLKLLAERGVEIFFTQVFRDSFFHADMHPGNIFVDSSDPQDPSYIAVDCAIVGSLSEADQHYLGRNLLGVFQRDYREVARLHVECGWVPADTRVEEFESAMRAVCEPVFEKPISEISFGQLLVYLFQTAARFDMEIQPSLVLLQKTLLNIEGLGRQLYPQLNLWDTAQPFLENWVKERYAPQAVIARLQRQAPSILEQLPHVPEAVLNNLLHKPSPNHATQKGAWQRKKKQKKLRVRYAGIACVALAVLLIPDIRQLLSSVPPTSYILLALAVWLILRNET